MEKEQSEFETRCRFNAYCKKELHNELIDYVRESKKQLSHEISIDDLTPHEAKQLFVDDNYFVDRHKNAFCVHGLIISKELLNEALRLLPKEKLQVIVLYYFSDMTDIEIAELISIPRSTVQYRRTSSFELLKRFLEERADEY